MAISPTLRVPFVYVEFDSSRAFQGPALLNYRGLLIGQYLSTGSKYEASQDAVGPYVITSADQAADYFGAGSQLALMAESWFLNNKINELHAIALKDNGSTTASGSIAITGPATAAGELSVYIDGQLVAVTVADTDTETQIGDALVAAITSDLPVTAANVTGTVTFTAKNAGSIGNDIDIRVNYNDGEVLPAGVSVVVTPMASGATDPDIADALDLIGDEWYQIICAPYTDATNLGKIEIELADRFGPTEMIDGLYMSSKRGDLSALSTFGNGRNSPHVSVIHNGGVTGVGSPSSPLALASAYAAQICKEGSADPARPFQTLQLAGILPPAVTERFTLAENNTLLYDGIATFQLDNAGAVRIQRAITMYQTNAAGAADIAYLDVNTLLTLMYLRYSFRTRILTKYPRAKLADDGVQVAPGQQVITPKVGRAEAIAIFRQWEFLGLVEDADQFKNDLVCIRSTTDPNRLEWVLPPDLMNQFRVGAAQMQFLLQG